MKKLMTMAIAVAVLCGFATLSMAGTTYVTNDLGQVFTVVADANGVHVSAVTVAAQPASASQTEMNFVGFRLVNAVGSATSTITPRQAGDVRIGILAGVTNGVWMAVGPTTNDWVEITN